MQFKHPELLYALLLLIIPIIVHLFQLRKFQKVDFTNVKFLKEVTLQTRKSSQIKKWLTLLTRLLIIAFTVLAFAQPYFSNSDSFNTKSETVIYLDNSFSMQAKGNNGTLLNRAIQDIIEYLPENERISIFANNKGFNNTTIKAIKNDLIQLQYSPNQLSYDAAILKGKKAFSKDESSLKNLILVSDFQQKEQAFKITKDSSTQINLVQLKPINLNNVTIDSTYISKTTAENIELTVLLKNEGNPIETLPVSLYNNEKLIAKSSVSIDKEASTLFTIPTNQEFNGQITINDSNLNYDDSLFFNMDKNDKINVLSINEANDSFLKKIYTKDEFLYTSFPFNAINYNSLANQNLIILNELKTIPNSLITALKAFTNDGGFILIIPSGESNITSYNQLFTNYSLSKFNSSNKSEKRITTIHFSHPLLANVFDKKVSNFQYPKVNSFYTLSSRLGSSILSYEDGSSFLSTSNNVYVFSASLQDDNSNFKHSPLIVPVLYNIGRQSLKIPQLYYTIGKENVIDINTKLLQDDILTLNASENSVIPLQRTFTNKVELITNEFPNTAGIVSVKNNDVTLKNLSFNFSRNESSLAYTDLSMINNANISNSLASTINTIKSATNINELWKWFVIFALLFLVIEMLILKYFR